MADPLDTLIEQHCRDLARYQSRAYARRYRARVERVRVAEARHCAGSEALTRVFASQLARLMSYNDEYEVARLLVEGRFAEQLDAHFEGIAWIKLNLETQRLPSVPSGAPQPGRSLQDRWLMAGFKLMMKLRVLRGTPLDPFGFHPDRKLERSLIAEYVSVMDRCLPFLTAATLPIVIDVAGVPETIRGCGPVKRRHAEAARTEYAVLMDRLRHHVPLSASLSAAQ